MSKSIFKQFCWSTGAGRQVGAYNREPEKPDESSHRSGIRKGTFVERYIGRSCLCVATTSGGPQLSMCWWSWGHCWLEHPAVKMKSWIYRDIGQGQTGNHQEHLQLATLCHFIQSWRPSKSNGNWLNLKSLPVVFFFLSLSSCQVKSNTIQRGEFWKHISQLDQLDNRTIQYKGE